MGRYVGQAAAREQLLRWYRSGLEAIDPARTTAAAIAAAPAPTRAPALLAIGKAAPGMLRGALAGLAQRGRAPSRVLAITHDTPTDLPPDTEVLLGDHPGPGTRSLAAAERLGTWVRDLDPGEPVIALLSGGTSALIAAPVHGITPHELEAAFAALHARGLDIVAMNAVRRHLTRWSGGRLATALGARDLVAYVISDVAGNRLGAIGSGPLVGGDLDPDAIARVLADPGSIPGLPRSAIAALAAPVPGTRPVRHVVVSDAEQFVAAIARAAAADGAPTVRTLPRLTSTTADAAREVATMLHREFRDRRPGLRIASARRTPELLIWGAEMTVTLPAEPGRGGRLQQFALELALVMERDTTPGLRSHGPVVLAATSDGRDGPTDVGAVLTDAALPDLIRADGRDPADLVARRDTHDALERAGALVRTGPTGTNVADVVVALLDP
ncbi:MAG: DUF4147 domain-containing protein [Gemmatimonadetes bacterium]|nr:DUF4147 domain-containing protein [Gemmatimonadota bacterium]